jgi:uncharacterized protein HemX
MFSSVIQFFKGSVLAAMLLAGVVGLAAGGALVTVGTHLASTTTQQTATQGQTASHGADVKSAVAKCKAALPAGQHGIGKCVSAVANQHGKAVSGGASQNGQKNDTQDAAEAETGS